MPLPHGTAGLLVALALSACASGHRAAPVRQAAQPDARTAFPFPGANDSAWFEVDVPAGVTTVRAVVVFIDRELDRYAYDDRDWRSMCVRAQCALLRLGLGRQDGLPVTQRVRNAALGGGAALLQALTLASSATGHPELAKANVVVFGFSAAGNFAATFGSLYPERTVGLIMFHSNLRGIPFDTAKLATVPALSITGGNDDVAGTQNADSLWRALRARNAPWAHVIQVGQPHYTLDGLVEAGFAMRSWTEALIGARMGATAGTRAPSLILRDSGWYLSRSTYETAAARDFHAPASDANWLPTEIIALGFRQMAGMCATAGLQVASALLGAGAQVSAEDTSVCRYSLANPKRDLWLSANRMATPARATQQLHASLPDSVTRTVAVGNTTGRFAADANGACSTVGVTRQVWIYLVTACGDGFGVPADSAKLIPIAKRAAGFP